MLKISQRSKNYLGLFLWATFLTLVFTFPVVLDPNKIIFGYAGDNFGNIWFFWWQKFAAAQHWSVSPTPLFNAPVGYPMNTDFSEVFWLVPGQLFTFLTNEILTFNLLIFLSFVGAFLSMYLLANFLTKSQPAAFLTAVIFAFSPYHYWQALSHLSLSLVFWLPLFALALFYFDRKKNLRAAVFLAVTWILTTLTTFYYGFFALLVGLTFFGSRLVFKFRDYVTVRVLGLLLFSALLAGLGVLPVMTGFLRARGAAPDDGLRQALNRQLDELVGLSARPWDYLIYPPNHPVFGRFNKPIYDFIQSKGNDFKVRSAYLPERVVFLGLLNAGLALAAVVLLRRTELVRTVFWLGLISFLISMPPYFIIKGLTFYTPSYFLYTFFPFVRVYARFGVFVLLFTCLLTSFSLKRIFEKVTDPTRRKIIFLALAAVFLAEFMPDFKAFTDLRQGPPVYNWLAQQPGDFIIAEYPPAFDLQTGLLFQRLHAKRLFNMPSGDPRFKLWERVANLADHQSRLVLKEQAVKYVIYHLRDLTVNPYDDWRFFRFAKPPTPEAEAQIELAGFKKVEEFPEAIVYAVE